MTDFFDYFEVFDEATRFTRKFAQCMAMSSEARRLYAKTAAEYESEEDES